VCERILDWVSIYIPLTLKNFTFFPDFSSLFSAAAMTLALTIFPTFLSSHGGGYKPSSSFSRSFSLSQPKLHFSLKPLTSNPIFLTFQHQNYTKKTNFLKQIHTQKKQIETLFPSRSNEEDKKKKVF
jgi:hypothetical protein